MSESEKPQASNVIIEHCDHMDDNLHPSHGDDMVIHLGPMRIIVLCMSCSQRVVGTVLTDIVTRATRQYLPELIKQSKESA